ncbi:MAG: type II secretion system F family protein [Planctomycetota bacterium]|nr:MAG: type II secretion system F family protein [Planctomycetota bacterium]
MKIFDVYAIICLVLIALGILYLFFKLITAWDRRKANERIVIGQIRTVVRQNLSLSTALAIAAESERGAARTHLRRISKLLSQGLSLSRAVHLGFPNCSSIVVSLIAAGEHAGQLPLALEQAEQYLIERDWYKERFVDTVVWPYVIIVLVAITLVMSGLMVAVVPKYKAIFQDFNTELPMLTKTIIRFSEEFAALFWLIFFVTIISVPIGIYLSLRPRRIPDPTIISRIFDRLRWYCPFFRDVEFGRGMSAMLRTIRMSIRSGMSLEKAAQLASSIDVNVLLRPRMARFAELLAGGMNVRKASDHAGLGELTGVALAGGQRSGNMDAALRYASDYYVAIVSRTWSILRNMVWPIWVLILGVMVGLVVIAMFMPLVALINAATG